MIKDYQYNLTSTMIKDYPNNLNSTMMKDYQYNLSSTMIKDYPNNLNSTMIKDYQNNLSSTMINYYPNNLTSTLIKDYQYNINSTMIKDYPNNLNSTIMKEYQNNLNTTMIKDYPNNLTTTITKDYHNNLTSTKIKDYQNNLTSTLIKDYLSNLSSTIIGKESLNIFTSIIKNSHYNLSSSIIGNIKKNISSSLIKENSLNLTSTIIKEKLKNISSSIIYDNHYNSKSTIIKINPLNQTNSTNGEKPINSTNTTIEKIPGNMSSSTIVEPLINTTPQFNYHSVELGSYSNGYYYFDINVNAISIISINIIKIYIFKIEILNIIYNATCYLEESKSTFYNYKFKCSFIPPPRYFSSIKIYEPINVSNFKLVNWPKDEAIIEKEMLYTNNKFSLISYNNLEICDMYSDSFSFEIEMNSNLKEGTLINKTILLNISQPSSVDLAKCYLKNINLNTNIKLNCYIYNLNQEKRITNGFNIDGIIKNNITDEYLITNNNEYINLIDFKEIKFTNLECPKVFEIKHCKNINKNEKICKNCYKNYYLNNNECLTCSQLNEGCSSCNGNGKCIKCLNGFELKGNNCVKKVSCSKGRYGSECKKCEELNSNCDECNNSGYCTKCEKGYYLTGIDNNSKCVKCLSTCEECESLNKCTKCKDELFLNNGSCVTCLSLNEGCEKCSKSGKCTQCYNNNLFQYKIKNDKCTKIEEDKKEKKEKKEKNKNNLKFERFDGYEQEDDKVHFKPHFILLDNYLYNTALHITIIIQIKIIYLRALDETENIQSIEKDIICDQYGDALGNNNKGGYLANFKCTMNLEDNQELLSMEPTKMEIKDKNNEVIQTFDSENKAINVSQLDKLPLDEEYENYIFNKISISDIKEIKLKNNNLSFNIIGNIDSSIENEKDFEISLKDNDNIMNATCHFPILNDLDNQSISCLTSINKNSKNLTFIQGVYSSKVNNDDILILINNDDLDIKIPETKSGLSTVAIIGIVIGSVVFISIIVFLIIYFKYIALNNKNIIPQTEKDYHKDKIVKFSNSARNEIIVKDH